MADTLITSISGIRGIFGRGLDPGVLVRYAGAFGTWCSEQAAEAGNDPIVVLGRDARVTGPLCAELVGATIRATGCTVVDAGMTTTPTVEMAVREVGAAGGIILSASHNPAEWNALKLLNGEGEFLTPEQAEAFFARANEEGGTGYVTFDEVGDRQEQDFTSYHIDQVLGLDFIEPDVIAGRDFRVVVDGVNSVGGVVIPRLLESLGVDPEQIICMHCEPTGLFEHEAEPLPENLQGLIRRVAEEEADLGIAVDPDVDRLALVADGGRYVSEELTQVIAADFLWRFREGPFATNLSSSRAIEDVAARHGQQVYRSAVGEINVVEKMKEVDAVLGGEGNGGVILPDLHYGRDALVGTAVTLQHLANEATSLSALLDALPHYTIVKKKTPIGDREPAALLDEMAERYADEEIDTVDGVKIDFEEGWVHMRTSNTEPIIRIYAEAGSVEEAEALSRRFMQELADIGE